MLRRPRSYRLFRGRFVTDHGRDWLRAALAACWLFGPRYLLLRASCARAPRRRIRAAEQRWARAAARALGLRIEIDGLEHIEPGQRYVVIALHESFADALALTELPLPLTAVVREELADAPLLGARLRAGRHLLIAPERPLPSARTLLADARMAVAEGDSVLVFPQGSILGLEVAFQPGAFALARRLDRPVLPVVITGGHRVWEHPFAGVLRFGQRISVRILSPVPAVDAVRHRHAIERAMKTAAGAPEMAPARRFDPVLDGYWDGYRYDVDPAYPDIAQAVAAHREAMAHATAHVPAIGRADDPTAAAAVAQPTPGGAMRRTPRRLPVRRSRATR